MKNDLPDEGKLIVHYERIYPDYIADEESLAIWILKVLREYGLRGEIEGIYNDYDDDLLNDIE